MRRKTIDGWLYLELNDIFDEWLTFIMALPEGERKEKLLDFESELFEKMANLDDE